MVKAGLAALALAVFAVHALNVSYAPPAKDGRQYVTFAFNLARHATFSRDLSDAPRPSNYREPLWPAVLAAGMALHPGIDVARDSRECVRKGEPPCLAAVSQLKLVNAAFLAATAWLAAQAALATTGLAAAAVLTLCLVAFDLRLGVEANRFYSEVLAALLATALSLALLRASAPKASPRWAGAAGGLAGLLALAKSLFQPLPVLLVAAMAALGLARREPRRSWLSRCAWLALGAAVVMGPWMVRNQLVFGSPTMSSRRFVLLYRANLAEADWARWRQAFVAWAPNVAWLAEARERLDPQAVRFLDKHAPEGFYELARARFEELQREGGDWDVRARDEALAKIRAHPVGYLAWTLPLAWAGLFDDRGFGLEPGRGAERHLGESWLGLSLPYAAVFEHSPGGDFWISLALFGSGALATLYALLRRRADLVFLLLPFLYSYPMHVLYSHAVGRFALPHVPVLTVCAVFLGVTLVRYTRSGFPLKRTLLGSR